MEHLSTHWLDLPQILNLIWEDQTKINNALNEDNLHTKIENCFKLRQPPVEDNLKILKVYYLSNH